MVLEGRALRRGALGSGPMRPVPLGPVPGRPQRPVDTAQTLERRAGVPLGGHRLVLPGPRRRMGGVGALGRQAHQVPVLLRVGCRRVPVLPELLAGELAQLVPGALRDPGVRRHPRVEPGGLGLEVLLDAVEALGAEEAAQQVPALVRPRREEPRELPLRQHDDLHELLGVQVHDGADLLPHLVGAGQRGAPLPVPLLAQGRGRLGRGGAGAALLPAGVARRAGHLEPAALDGELDEHLGGHRPRRTQRGHEGLGRAPAGHRAVQGVAEGGQDGGLARTGGPVEQEEPGAVERLEVDVLGVGVRADARQAHAVDPHACVSFVRAACRAASSRAVSSSVAARSRTWWTKPVVSTRSDGASRRAWA